MTDSTINRFLMSGTNAERLAHTPNLATPASGPDPSVIWKETDTGNTYMWNFGGAAWQQVNGGLADADYGDIVVSSGVWSVDNNAVSYAKMQDVSATSRILGRKTSGAGDPEECTLSQVLDFIGSAAQGDILYRGSSGWARLAAGTSGNVLTTGGSGANPSWASSATNTSKVWDHTWGANTTASATAFAFRGLRVLPQDTIIVDGISTHLVSPTSSGTYVAYICTMSSTTTIGSVLGTSATLTATSTARINPALFTFATPITLSPGTAYALFVGCTSSSGTTPLSAPTTSTAVLYTNAPLQNDGYVRLTAAPTAGATVTYVSSLDGYPTGVRWQTS